MGKIGDPCNTNSDCSALGDRFCDTSAPCGYCTVESCDVRVDENGVFQDSCPSEATCVRFFESVDRACDPRAAAADIDRCPLNQRCVCDYGSTADIDPACVGPNADPSCAEKTSPLDCRASPLRPTDDLGNPVNASVNPSLLPSRRGMVQSHCAPESSERRWCQYVCDGKKPDHGDSDCRVDQGFHCVQVGTNGSQYVERSLSLQTLPNGSTRAVPVGIDPMVNNAPRHWFCVCTDPRLCYPTNSSCGMPRPYVAPTDAGSPDGASTH